MARRLVVVVGIAMAGRAATASPGPGDETSVVTGDVVAATSRWTADGSRIVTTATIRSTDGTLTTVSQLGGRVGTLSMRTIPGPPVLATGMTVQTIVRDARTARGDRALAVETVDVLHDDFVRTGPTPDGHYLYWASGCTKVGYGAEGTRAISGDDEFAVIEDVFANWTDSAAGCSYMNIVSEGTMADHEVGTDKVNIIKFRDVTWCRPAVDDDPARCYSPLTAGLTTVVYVDDPGNDRDGEIVDADIELNGVDFAISIDGVSQSSVPCQSDLANTLTHEVGHLLGLEHTCLAAGDPARVDGNGDPVPACDDVTPGAEITEATMFNFQSCGETKKASLSQDDIDGVCAAYPTADDPHECKGPGEGGGCAAGGSTPAGPFALSLVALALIRRRKLR